jgi:hypothetical protein
MIKTFSSSKSYINQKNYFKGPQSFGHDVDDTNYAEFEADGSLKFYGTATVWEDLRFPATAINPAGAPSAMVFDTTNIGFLASASSTQVIAIIAQIPHSWKTGSTIFPHIHWEPTTTNIGNVVWRMEYKWTNIFDTESSAWLTPLDLVAPADGVVWKHQLSSFEGLSGAGKSLSSLITIKISRIGGSDLDTYTGNALLKEFDIHYEIDTLGSREEYFK